MLRLVPTALVALTCCACFVAKTPEADGGGPLAEDAGAPRSCASSADCEAGEHCDVELTACGHDNRSVLASARCTRPACGSASTCLRKACASNDDCPADQTCGATGPSDRCDQPCCLPWGRCAAMPTCPEDCVALWPPHETCFACLCPSCEPAPRPDAGGLVPEDGGGLVPEDGGGVVPEDGGGLVPRDAGGVPPSDAGQGCLTSEDCPAGEHCDVVLDSCGGGEAVLVSSKCTRPACGAACLGQACASSDECAEGQTCGMGGPGGPNCSSPCCQNWGRCAMMPNCAADCVAIWPPHATCFACVCPSCERPDAGS